MFFLFKRNRKKISNKRKNPRLTSPRSLRRRNKVIRGGDVLFAAKKFNDAEKLFPQSEWAPKSALMAAYSYYTQDYYLDAVAELERFIKLYPNNKNLDYAYYLLAVCHYEQIIDETKDLKSIMNAKKNFRLVIKNFPNTQYALDSEFKIDLINDTLASKEMYIGRYYIQRKNGPAITGLEMLLILMKLQFMLRKLFIGL